MKASDTQNSQFMKAVNKFYMTGKEERQWEEVFSISEAIKLCLKINNSEIKVPIRGKHYPSEFIVKGREIEVYNFNLTLISELEDYLLDPEMINKQKEDDAFLNMLNSCTYSSIGRFTRLSNTNFFYRYM